MNHVLPTQFPGLVVYLVPGLISMSVYRSCSAAQARLADIAIDVMIGGFVTNLVGLVLFQLILFCLPLSVQPIATSIAVILVYLVVPIALGWGWFEFERHVRHEH